MSLLLQAAPILGSQSLDEAWDILVIAGQSNASGRGNPVDLAGLDAPDPRILQWDTEWDTVTGTSSVLESPWISAEGTSTDLSFAVSLAKEYLADRSSSARKVVVVNGGYGGTGLLGGNPSWLDNNFVRNNMLTRIGEVWAAAPAGSRFVGMFWSQGESDSTNGTTAAYTVALGGLIDEMRATVMGDVPFVVLSMVPDWVSAGRAPIDLSHENVPALREQCAYVVGDDTGNADDIHYDAVQQRANGSLLLAGLDAAALNTSAAFGTPTAPVLSSATSATAGEIATTYSVTGPLEKHEVQYKLQADSTWITAVTTYGDVAAESPYTIQSLAAGDYDVRVVATNFVGDTASTVTQVNGVASSGLTYIPIGNGGDRDKGYSTNVTGFTATPNTREVRWRVAYDDWSDGDKFMWGTAANATSLWAAQTIQDLRWRGRTRVNGTQYLHDGGQALENYVGIKTWRMTYDYTGGTGPTVTYWQSVDNLTPIQNIVEEVGGWEELGTSDNLGETTQTMDATSTITVGYYRNDYGDTRNGQFYEGAWYENGVLEAECIPPSAGVTTWVAATGETWTADATTVQ